MDKIEQIESLVKDWRREVEEDRNPLKKKSDWEKGAFDVLETVVQELEKILF